MELWGNRVVINCFMACLMLLICHSTRRWCSAWHLTALALAQMAFARAAQLHEAAAEAGNRQSKQVNRRTYEWNQNSGREFDPINNFAFKLNYIILAHKFAIAWKLWSNLALPFLDNRRCFIFRLNIFKPKHNGIDGNESELHERHPNRCSNAAQLHACAYWGCGAASTRPRCVSTSAVCVCLSVYFMYIDVLAEMLDKKNI